MNELLKHQDEIFCAIKSVTEETILCQRTQTTYTAVALALVTVATILLARMLVRKALDEDDPPSHDSLVIPGAILSSIFAAIFSGVLTFAIIPCAIAAWTTPHVYAILQVIK